MEIKAVLESCLYGRDLDAMEQFYSNILQLKLFSKQPDRHIFYRCGKGMCLIFNPDVTNQKDAELPAHGSAGNGHLAFAVDPATISYWQAHLEKNHVKIELIKTWPGGGISLYFRDPAHNSIEITSADIWGIQ